MTIMIYKLIKQKLLALIHINAYRFSSAEYWDKRYKENGTSGVGSYSHLAEFKANFLNMFVDKQGIKKVIEFGCGDGNQLRLSNYPEYIGFDVSITSILMCKKLFSDDSSKSFFLSSDNPSTFADLVLSLDVIYHLVEDDVYHCYMQQLFSSSTRYVIIYSSNTIINDKSQSIHVRHRKFTDWINLHAPYFHLVQYVPNEYPLRKDNIYGSFADFYVFEKKA